MLRELIALSILAMLGSRVDCKDFFFVSRDDEPKETFRGAQKILKAVEINTSKYNYGHRYMIDMNILSFMSPVSKILN